MGTLNEVQDQTSAEKRASMTPDQVRGRLWAKRLKRVFEIDIETCSECGGKASFMLRHNLVTIGYSGKILG